MQQKKPLGSFFSDVQSTLKDFAGAFPTASPFDLKSVMETQRKNLQAVSDASERAMVGWQALARRQTEMFSQLVQDNAEMVSAAMAETTAEGKIAKQAELVQATCEKSIANTKELAKMMTQCTKEAAEGINERIKATMSEIRASAQKPTE